MSHHDIKSHPKHFQPSLEDKKQFEIRRNDRDYKVGDTVTMHEYHYDHGDNYTGRKISGRIIYVDDFAQQDGYIVFGVQNWRLLIIN